jgi:hypothetical protein
MGLTILAIPLIILGVFIKPYAQDGMRCISVGFAAKGAFCFEQDSRLPETIKYGSAALGFLLLYAGRRQIKRQRGQE